MKSRSKERTTTTVNLTVKRRYLTEREVERLMNCARKHSRHGHRDATMILVAYRHGLREAYVFVSERGGPINSTGSSSASRRPPRCHSRSTDTCFATPAASSWPTTATTRGPCSITSGTRTFSTPSDTPKWRPTGSKIFGGTDDDGADDSRTSTFEEDDAPYRRD